MKKSDKKGKGAKTLIQKLFREDRPVEILILGAKGKSTLWHGKSTGPVFGLFDNPKELIRTIKRLKTENVRYEDVFLSLHRIKSNFDSGTELNELYAYNKDQHQMIGDDDVLHYRFLYIDVDEKAKKKPISVKRLNKIIAVRDKVADYLMDLGMPKPIKGNSGNGGNLLFLLAKHPNKEAVREQIRLLLKHLDGKFNCDCCKIDLKVGNPGRLFRAPGTENRKGEETETRKYRKATTDSMPFPLKMPSKKNFEAIIDKLDLEIPEPEVDSNEHRAKVDNDEDTQILDVPAYLEHYDIKVVNTKRFRNSTLYCLDACVFNPDHSPNEAAIGQVDTGKMFYQCFHDSCSGRMWKAACRKISGKDKLSKFMKELDDKFSRKKYKSYQILSAKELVTGDYPFKPIIKNLLGEGENTIFFGTSGIKKSFLSLYLALYGARPPKDDMLFGKFEVPAPFTTLFVQSENNKANTSRRLKLMLKGSKEFENSLDSIRFLGENNDCRITGELSDPDFQDKIIEVLYSTKADVLVLDPLISYHNVEENSNTAMRNELDCLKDICDTAGISAIVIHHSSKSWDNKSKGGRGASAISDWADNIISLTPEDHGGKEVIKLTCQKSRNFIAFSPFCLRVTGEMLFERTSMDTPESSNIVVEALNALGGKVSKQEELTIKISELSNCGKTTAYKQVNLAESAGVIVKFEEGRSIGYRLVSDDAIAA